jgi:uncharacterized protein YbjT (DUF2867 family)
VNKEDIKKSKILITGASGNVGGELARLLGPSDARVRIAATNAAKARKSWADTYEVVQFNLLEGATFQQALKGINKVFLVRPPQLAKPDKDMLPFIKAMKSANIEQVVFLSLQGVEKNSVVPHHKIEKLIVEHELPYTFLRPSFFMQNLSTTHRDDIVLRNEIVVPAGKGKTSFIDVRDIAAVGAKVLTEPGHINAAYELTGNDALDYHRVAELMTEELGRPITYTRPSAIRFFFHMRSQGIPVKFILVMIALYSVARLGKAAHLTDTTERLLGRAPISMRQFIKDHKQYWQKER